MRTRKSFSHNYANWKRRGMKLKTCVCERRITFRINLAAKRLSNSFSLFIRAVGSHVLAEILRFDNVNIAEKLSGRKKEKIAMKSFEATAREKIGINLTHILERFFYFRIHMDGSFLMAFKHNKSQMKETQVTLLRVADLQPATNISMHQQQHIPK